MTMIPPKIKKLPGLRQPQTGYIANKSGGKSNPNKSVVYQPQKMVR
jgi:hypothetical protein